MSKQGTEGRWRYQESSQNQMDYGRGQTVSGKGKVKKKKKREGINKLPTVLLIMAVIALLVVSGIDAGMFDFMREDSGEIAEATSTEAPAKPGSYDSADTAVLVGRDEKAGTMTFLNPDRELNYTLNVNGATRFYDKYGQILAAGRIKVGEVVDVAFLKEEKLLASVQLSKDAWSYDSVENYEIDTATKRLSVGSETYKLTDLTRYFSEGRSIELMDINSVDVLSIRGIGKQVLSVCVDKGHGYLRLANDEHFVGGWIEIGQTRIHKITEDMLLVVPEGSYQVNISNNGGGGIKNIDIYKNEETTLDIGDLEVPQPEKGMVLFSLNPADAELYIDGVPVDTSYAITLEYGLHQLIARAEGYQSITRYIRVAQPSAGINVELDLAGSGSEETDEEKETTTDYYKVYVDAPLDAEVYLNGNYVGIAPCSFKKEKGTYVIILRKDGYVTKSYTVTIDDSEKDLSYSFADLEQNTLTNQ